MRAQHATRAGSSTSAGRRTKLARIIAAQGVAGWSVDDHECEVSGETVLCRYVQRDLVLDRWELTLTGRHRYIVREGELVFAERVHDPESRDVAYAAFEAFRAWVEQVHPELVDVIWSDPSAALYSTPDGARAVLDLLDEYGVGPRRALGPGGPRCWERYKPTRACPEQAVWWPRPSPCRPG